MPDSIIVAMGGGGFSMEPENPRLDDYVLSLVRGPRPKVCFLGTASGDDYRYIVRFYTAFTSERCHPAHLRLFDRTEADLRSFVLAQDVIYVGGGSTSNMLSVWRVHGLDVILREAWERGIILSGLSAGAVCWHEAGPTDSFGPMLQPLRDALGFVPGSFCPHYDAEPKWRPRSTGSSPKAHCRPAWPQTTAWRWCTGVRTWRRSSPRGPTPGRGG